MRRLELILRHLAVHYVIFPVLRTARCLKTSLSFGYYPATGHPKQPDRYVLFILWLKSE